jgi:hypothetical protein
MLPARLLASAPMSDMPSATPADASAQPRGRTPALPAAEQERLFREGIALFNGVRYWHAHEAWETLWRAAPDDQRDFYQGLIQIAAGLLHLQRRNQRGARNKLREGLDRLRPYEPAYEGIFVNELIGEAGRLLDDLERGHMPYLISPVIRFTEAKTPDFHR